MNTEDAKLFISLILSENADLPLIEKMLTEIGYNITCVDPNPLSYSEIITNDQLLPAYETIDDYLECNDHDNNMALMLIWTNPNESVYDYEAI